MNRTRLTLAVAALALLGAHAPSIAGTFKMSDLRTDPDGISGFDVFYLTDKGTTNFVWWKNVSQASTVGRVRRANVWLKGSPPETKDEGCCILQSDYSNAVADGHDTYYFGVEGKLSRKGVMQNLFMPPVILPAPPLPPEEPGSYLELFDDTLFWSSYNAPNSQLHLMPKDASQPPKTLLGVAGRIKKIQGFETEDSLGWIYKRLAFLTEDGRIYWKNLDDPSDPQKLLWDNSGAPVGDFTDFDVSVGNGYKNLYASTGDTSPFVSSPPAPGRVLVYDATVGYYAQTITATGDFQVVDVAVGKNELWTIEIGDYSCQGGTCTPQTRRIVTYDLQSSQRDVFSSPDLATARHLVYTSVGFMLVRDDDDTIYLVSKNVTFDGGSRDDSDAKEEYVHAATRGDATNDGRVNKKDVEAILECQKTGAECFDCAAAADANADGRVDIRDATYLLSWMYEDGPPPPPPGPYECGEIELDERDSCRESSCDKT